MSAVPGDVDPDQQPPMAVPLRHFLVALGFLALGAASGAWALLAPSRGATLAHLHLLLVGWVCVTIMGAMTQFVPVWSGEPLHSRRLATWQLPPVAVGLLGFAAALWTGALRWTPLFGGLLLLGFWTFAYNIGRTLRRARPLDVTERHFAAGLGFFVLLTALGLLLAVDFATPLFGADAVPRASVVGAHATLAVFGAVLTTVFGALYQLGTMFTQTDLDALDRHLQRVETAGYPLGVLLLAAGRLATAPTVARVGGLLVVVGTAAVAVVLGRRLRAMRVDWTPMHRRYAVAVPAMGGWAALTLPAWLADPLGHSTLLGGGPVHLLAVGVVGFVVLGTLYHVVPFIVWVHRYSDRLGLERVPMIDDLYDDRVALVEFGTLVAGTALLVGAHWLPGVAAVRYLAAGLLLVGVALFVGNLVLVVHRHGGRSVGGLLFGRGSSGESA